MQLRSELKQFVLENFLFGRKADLKDGDSFLDNGIIDSTGVLELVTFLEDRFAFTLDDHDLVPENLDSIDNLTRFVERKLASLAGKGYAA
jgi:acyl carrier protein